MSQNIITARTRQLVREYFVGTTLARIDDAFQAAEVECDGNFDPPVSGQRRTRVEQYYHSLDFRRWEDARRFIMVSEHVLDELENAVSFGDDYQKKYAESELHSLLRSLQRDGFVWAHNRLTREGSLEGMHGIQEAVAALDAPELSRQLSRLRESVNEDPPLAIGTAKEMLETTCKTILGELDVVVDPGWDIPALLKETRKRLKLLPDDVPASAKGAKTIHRLLSNLGQIGQGLSELRNLYGTGHGRAGRATGVSPRHARLAVGAVATLVQFLFETHQERQVQ